MKLSICIPTYNRPDLLAQAVQSVLEQDYEDYELLIHDNSEDCASENSIKCFSDDRIQYFRHSRNIGMIGNWNSLLATANCKYIKFLNDDDIMLPGCLRRTIIAILEAERDFGEIGAISCRASYVDNSGELIKLDRLGIGGQADYFIAPKYAAYLWYMGELRLRTPTQMTYNKRLAQKAGGFDINMAYASDVELALKLSVMGGVAILDKEPLVQFTFHSGQGVCGVPVQTRLDDQIRLATWAREHVTSPFKLKELRVILGEICLREFALMIRAFRIRDSATALNTFFKVGSFLSFIYFIQNNTSLIQKFNANSKSFLYQSFDNDRAE